MEVIRFPKLKDKQVALLRAERMTGKVLDENFQRYQLNSNNQVDYSIFPSLEETKNYIKQMKSVYLNIEYHVYDVNEKEIYTEVHKD